MRILLALAAVALLLTLAVILWWTNPPDPVREIEARYRPLADVHRTPSPTNGEGVERWQIVDASGDTVHALWRPAPPGIAQPWTIVMMGGVGTGAHAAMILPDDAPVQALAVDWPWRGPTERIPPGEFARLVPLIRGAALRAPAVLALAAEAAARQTEVDTARIALLGASLGVPPTMASLRLTRVPRALVLIDGFADLRLVLRVRLRAHIRPRRMADPLAALAFRLVRSLEPSLHSGAASNLPTILINAAEDEQIPRVAVDRLQLCLPHAEVRLRGGRHFRPERTELIRMVTLEVTRWLERLGRETGTDAPGYGAGEEGPSPARRVIGG